MLFKATAIAALLSISLYGCATSSEEAAAPAAVKDTKAAAPAATSNADNNDFYVAYHDGRINMFDDLATYKSFLALGETTFRLTRIVAGPNGETLVFGLTKKDKKKGNDAAVVRLYDGKLEGGVPFYGEVKKEGRYYVAGSFEDLMHVVKLGEPALRFADIGAGPEGETVVYVLNASNKKKKPEALIAKFKEMHAK